MREKCWGMLRKDAIAQAAIEIVEYPPFSPDLAPAITDYFYNLKNHLRHKCFFLHIVIGYLR